MARQLMHVIVHGVMRKVWIDPKDIYNESDVPFVAPPEDKQAIAEREARIKARDARIKATKDQALHADWNTPEEAKPAEEKEPPIVINVTKEDGISADKGEKPKQKRRKKGGRK